MIPKNIIPSPLLPCTQDISRPLSSINWLNEFSSRNSTRDLLAVNHNSDRLRSVTMEKFTWSNWTLTRPSVEFVWRSAIEIISVRVPFGYLVVDIIPLQQANHICSSRQCSVSAVPCESWYPSKFNISTRSFSIYQSPKITLQTNSLFCRWYNLWLLSSHYSPTQHQHRTVFGIPLASDPGEISVKRFTNPLVPMPV